jgi:hypothetical protein
MAMVVKVQGATHEKHDHVAEQNKTKLTSNGTQPSCPYFQMTMLLSKFRIWNIWITMIVDY